MSVEIGSVFFITMPDGSNKVFAHKDVFDFNSLISSFSQSLNFLKINILQLTPVENYFTLKMKADENDITKKFLFWLKKNDWADISSSAVKFIKFENE